MTLDAIKCNYYFCSTFTVESGCRLCHPYMCNKLSGVVLLIYLKLVWRFSVCFVALSLVFLAVVYLTSTIFVNSYSLIEVNSESESSENTTQVFEKSASPFPEVRSRGHSRQTSVEESDYESDCHISSSFLDHKQFYQNLNNSSQYLRRDSFSQ